MWVFFLAETIGSFRSLPSLTNSKRSRWDDAAAASPCVIRPCSIAAADFAARTCHRHVLVSPLTLSGFESHIKKEVPTPLVWVLLFWRSRWDSNPRAVARKLISSQPRYDHFDTAAYTPTRIPKAGLEIKGQRNFSFLRPFSRGLPLPFCENLCYTELV